MHGNEKQEGIERSPRDRGRTSFDSALNALLNEGPGRRERKGRRGG